MQSSYLPSEIQELVIKPDRVNAVLRVQDKNYKYFRSDTRSLLLDPQDP